ncbi:SGNH/GDSL hydrolase family protein [Cyclobacterium salsum]|uniref:SGNH/GDSL hydrolase family protein n=1 Tax=Cyclobacterium salsum TaxID=2666329 RepID=UPI00139145F7|nr:SGNH/GDSL hydrolase family protein [Cyclobacterium salsum]
MKNLLFLSLLFLMLCPDSFAQDPERFSAQVRQITQDYPPQNFQASVVFTGSSTIRMWKSLQEDFPGEKIVNSGFGGSQASDLLHYLDELVLDYAPEKVFIYEGDNDLAAGKTIEEIIETYNLIVSQIHLERPQTEIVLISPKPSLARWELADNYRELNATLKKYARGKKKVSYADLWNPMLNSNKTPMEDIFLEDDLHMNAKGYSIWARQIKKYL